MFDSAVNMISYFQPTMIETKQEQIELLIKIRMPLTTIREEQGVKHIYTYLPVSYTEHQTSGFIIKAMLFDRLTWKLSGEYFYVSYEEFSLSVWGGVPE
jgi:hypothetical protein